MKTIFVYQIVDDLSEGILHTFMAANDAHATDMFGRFCKSVKDKVDISDFRLISIAPLNVPDAYSDVGLNYPEVCLGEEYVDES